MKRSALIFVFLIPAILYGQKGKDSLVLFKDLKFHSEFEKKALSNYFLHKTDTFNLFLAIDSGIDAGRIQSCQLKYQQMVDELSGKRVDEKRINKRIRQTFSYIHRKYLKKYEGVEYFPELFESGEYNCVSSSIIFSMLFGQLGVDYKVQMSPGHVYLVANPGPSSVVVETTLPDLKEEEQLHSYKREYVSYLKSKKVISEDDYKSKSVDELFKASMEKVSDAHFDNLIGFQYYNMGLELYDKKKYVLAYQYLQKAYLFFPSKQVESVLFPTLIKCIENSRFKRVEDIDYIAHLSRYNDFTVTDIEGFFQDVLEFHLQFTDRRSRCDSLFNRFISQIYYQNDRQTLTFGYNLYMSKKFRNTDAQSEYIENAVKLKQNHRETNELFIEYLEREISKEAKYKDKLARINYFKKEYPYKFIQTLLYELEQITHLNQAYDYLSYNYIDDGEKYLKKFEKNFQSPNISSNKKYIRTIETTYRRLALYYFYHDDKMKAVKIIDRGLKFVPGSELLQSAVY